ncbi:nucleotide sugar dehydrogenase [Planococcus sp. 1R117A]|uniref:nucleotide sugar dehydrogenase n=1 Tax=Planococcus sp. 1R117A TaxID=3447020 RepID=UPI003EDC6B02
MMIDKLKIAVVGLGYVGLSIAATFAKKYNVIGIDIDDKRIEQLLTGIDNDNEIEEWELKDLNIEFTTDPARINEAGFIIVAVPTPIDSLNQPDLKALLSASAAVGKHMKKGAVVVFESTVYPGATEEQCIPVLEKNSGLEAGSEFFVGYSPERVQPKNKKQAFTKTKKVVSGQNEAVLDFVASVYGSVVDAGVFKAKSIRIAEAAKVIEDTQQDVNIAFINEVALIFNRLGIDTNDVLETAGTKKSFLKFTPGLVSGRRVGFDSYYLTHKAQEAGYHPEIILAGRRVNDGISSYIARTVVKKLVKNNSAVKGMRVTVLGITYKEDMNELRNSKVLDVIEELQEYSIEVQIADICIDPEEMERRYGLIITPESELLPASAVILAVPHKLYKEAGWKLIEKLLIDKKGLVFDIKSTLDPDEKPENIELWRF